MKSKTEFLDKSKKKKILKVLEKEYGVSDLKHLFIRSSKERFRIYSGNLSKEEINDLSNVINIELIGARLCTIKDWDTRLNFDIMNLPVIKNQITQNIQLIDEKNIDPWLRGNNVELKVDEKNKGKFLAIKNKNSFYGIGLNQKDHIKNYVPKERRIKGN
tara:strand:+ start:249 stop:728 length:480 start_codon:yes stop_codon:yes gene_type:complete